MDVTERFIKHITSVRYEDLPADVVMASKRAIMDTLGVLIGGSSRPGCAEIVELVKDWGGKPESTVLVYGGKVPAHEAVLANSTMARALDFDDVHANTGAHASATVVPVALATAELKGNTSGKEMIAAVALGIDVVSRMRLVPDLCIAVSGWVGEVHGTFGGAAAAGKILSLDQDKMRHALGLAFSQAAGSTQPFYDGMLATRVQQGFSARSGLLSALLARKGITGTWNFLEGKAGFYPVYYRGMKYDTKRLVDALGERYEVLNMAVKPYPCCGFIHAGIENVTELMRQNQLTEKDVSEVQLLVNQRMYTNVCTPEATRYRPPTVTDAMFSLAYCVGTAMVEGDVTLEDFTLEAIAKPRRLAAVDKVKIVVDKEVDAESVRLSLPLSLHIATVKTKDGRSFSNKKKYTKGYPQQPMTIEDCAAKMKKCAPFAARRLSAKKVDQLIDTISNLEQVPDVAVLSKFLC